MARTGSAHYKALRDHERGMKYKVRRMTAEGSKNWGIYVNADTLDAQLIEGGFFDREAAQYSADDLNRNDSQ